jgi:4-amino-4-deoxy-L-arabinose transferase-like glycosyltransferase
LGRNISFELLPCQEESLTLGTKLYEETVLGSERRDLALVLGLALGLRILLYRLTYVIAIDGAGTYFPMANHFASGLWREGLATGYHPMYPLLAAFFSKVLGDLQFSGQMVSVLFGTLTVIPIFYLARGVGNGRAGFFSSLFLAMLPYHVELSADLLSDTTYTFFFISAIWLGWEALKTEDWKMFLLAGFATGLAYLDRAEGIGVLLPLSLWILLRRNGFHKKSGCTKGFAIIIFVLSFLFVASPYILYLRSYTGTWTISRKPAVNRVVLLIKEKLFFQKQEDKGAKKFDQFIQKLQQEGDGASSGLVKWLKRTGSFFTFFVKTCHPLLFLFFIVGLTKRRVIPSWRGEGFLVLNLLLYVPILFWLASSSYISHRYFVPFVALCLVWSGRGLMESYLWLREKISSKRWEKVRFLESRGLLGFTLITIIAVLPFNIHSSGEGRIARKEAGLWIKNNSTSKPPIYTDMVLVNHYAGGQWIPLREAGLSYDELVNRAEKTGADFLVLSEEHIERICPRFFEMQRPEDLKEVFRVNRAGETIIVYRIMKR